MEDYVAIFGKDKLNATVVYGGKGGYASFRNPGPIDTLCSKGAGALTVDILKGLLKTKKENNIRLSVKGKTAKTGTAWEWQYSDSRDSEDHDTSERLTFGELVISDDSDVGRDAAFGGYSIAYKGKSLSASESAGYRNLSRPRTDTAAEKPREQKEGEVQSVHGVLTELAEAEGMTYDEFVTNGLGKLIWPGQVKEANYRTITLSKAKDEKVGVTVVAKEDYSHMGRGVLCTEDVMEVKNVRLGGVLDKHNQLQRDGAIQEGDVIVSVNGVHGDFDAMFAQFAKDSVVFEVERRGV